MYLSDYMYWTVVIEKISDRSSWGIDQAQILCCRQIDYFADVMVEKIKSRHEFITDVIEVQSLAY